jgi:hypothetical protein
VRVGLTTRSLKTQQHATALKPCGMQVLARPGSVDIPSDTAQGHAGSRIGAP